MIGRWPAAVRSCLAATAFLAASITGSRAHPHVWITTEVGFVFDGAAKPVGLSEVWRFDEMYSSFATQGLDRNHDGKLSRDELAALSRTILKASGEQANFTVATLGGEALKLSPAKDAWAELGADGKLALHFRLDFETPLDLAGRALRVEVYDPDLYADFRFADRPTFEVAAPPRGCSARLDDPKSHLPDDPKAIEDALINGPLIPMTSAMELVCK